MGAPSRRRSSRTRPLGRPPTRSPDASTQALAAARARGWQILEGHGELGGDPALDALRLGEVDGVLAPAENTATGAFS